MSNIVEEIKDAVEAAWDKLKPHVVPEAETDAKSVLDDLKAQAGQIGEQAVSDAKADAATGAVDVQQVATDALTALGVPFNDLPAEQRPTLPSDVEQGAVPGKPTVDTTPTVPEQASVPAAGTEAPADAEAPVEQQTAPTAVTTASNPGVVPGA